MKNKISYAEGKKNRKLEDFDEEESDIKED